MKTLENDMEMLREYQKTESKYILQKLLDKYQRLFLKKIPKIFRELKGDFIQHGHLALIKAFKSYDFKKPFISHCHYAILSEFQEARRLTKRGIITKKTKEEKLLTNNHMKYDTIEEMSKSLKIDERRCSDFMNSLNLKQWGGEERGDDDTFGILNHCIKKEVIDMFKDECGIENNILDQYFSGVPLEILGFRLGRSRQGLEYEIDRAGNKVKEYIEGVER